MPIPVFPMLSFSIVSHRVSLRRLSHHLSTWVWADLYLFVLLIFLQRSSLQTWSHSFYYCTPHIIKENSENFLIHRCNYILLSQVYCVWQVVKTPTVILNNPVLHCHLQRQVNNAFHKFPSWPYTQGLLMSVWTLRRHCSFQLCNTATLET